MTDVFDLMGMVESGDYRTRDEKMEEFVQAVAQTQAQLSEAIIHLQNRVTILERKLEHDRDQRG